MKSIQKYFPPLVWVAIFLAISFVIGQFTAGNMGWYAGLQKSALTPPGFVFPIAWTALYIMLAICGWLVWRERHKPRGYLLMALYWDVMFLNWAWSFVFFEFQMVFLGLACIALLNLANIMFIVLAWAHNRVSAYLMVPHLLWCGFATYLNYAVWSLN